ncbi:thiol reductant ABC exporter subunit CydC [Halomonas faecis]|uniref:thiol reductant ABC exporter subunit CydC n=1 Tax=Halomonas faecis TaxID=1562110 RepID=UPI0013CFA62C|nr:thiol reductant ABC exporter subunit CydC [Halomonas faecis]
MGDGLGVGALRPWLRLLVRRRRRLWVGAGLLGLTLMAAIGLLALSGWFITASALTGMAVMASLDVHVPGGGIRAFAVTRTVARYLERLYNHDTVLRLLADLRGSLFAVLSRLDGATLAQQRASDWLTRLTADIDTLDGLYLRLLAPPAVSLALIGLLAAFLGLWLPTLAWWVAIGLVLAWLWLTLGQAWLGMAASRAQVGYRQRLRSLAVEHLQGLAELEAHDCTERHRRRLQGCQRRLHAAQRRLAGVTALGTAVVGLAVGLAMLATLWLAAAAWQREAVSGAVMVMLPLAVLAIGEALALLPNAFTSLGTTRAAAERLNALVAAEQRAPSGRCRRLGDGPLALSLSGVSLRYPGVWQLALETVSLSLNGGERLALTGSSGAGKSSIAALLTRQLLPTAGDIRLGGVPLAEIDETSLRERVGLLGQRIDLFEGSLADNLRIADPAASDERLWRALDWVTLADWVETLSEGLATPVGEGGRALSGGQARRLALARLWLRDPGLVILDEPFAGLDRETVESLVPRLDAWLQGRTVLFLVHQLDDGSTVPPGVTHHAHLVAGQLTGFARHCAIGQDVGKATTMPNEVRNG